MKKVLLLTVMLIFGVGYGFPATDSLASIIKRLDESLVNKDRYVSAKQQRIGDIKKQEDKAYSDFARFQLCIRLYDEYKSFKYDSAHVYACKSLELAKRLDKPEFIIEAKCAITFCLLSAGLYREAFEELRSISIAGVSTECLKKYYWMASRLSYDMADYNHTMPYQDEYIKQGSVYTDSLLHLLPARSAEWLYAEGMRQMKEYHYDECVYTFRQLLRNADLDVHTRAVVTSCLGWIYFMQGEREDAKRYLAEAAICDNESATKETTALCGLAGMLYEEGDIERATRYVQFSLDDANYYDARQRKIQIGDILPIIEQDRYNMMKNERNAIIITLIVALLAIVILLFGTWIIRRQMRKLQEARRIIEQRNQEMQLANDKLCEANAIKDEYIGRTFYINAEYINKVEKLYKTIDRKIAARQYEDLRSTLKESTLNAERNSMFADFDETFLKLFPDFVRQFNLLFDEKDRRLPKDEKSLTSEMRIFALIRLGITEIERIANFLDYSVYTIKTYKTRVKNKSIVDNDLFEQRIMEIG